MPLNVQTVIRRARPHEAQVYEQVVATVPEFVVTTGRNDMAVGDGRNLSKGSLCHFIQPIC